MEKIVSMKKRTQSGITLIECIACIVILGTAVISGLSLAGVHSEVVNTDELKVLASRFLQRELELLEGSSYSVIESTAATTVDEDPRYSIAHTVVERSGMYKEVTITISWLSQNGIAQTESLTTLRCKNTLE